MTRTMLFLLMACTAAVLLVGLFLLDMVNSLPARMFVA
jgi:hypothetical protein